ncbi:MAG TPA: imidazolonepropionase, partial [Firmicutes bacterium]|nr:imidazolonepropionase [Bacillota bacterium]
AHAWPEEFRDNHEGYVRLIISMIPEVAALGTVRYCDVFFEEGVFDVAQSRRILQAAKICGLTPKVHADEINDLGGAALAAEIGAVSAEHLLKAGDDGLRKMAAGGTVAVLLPGTAFSLMTGAYARARDMIAMGVPVALATDCNPGSSPTESMPMVLNLAAFAMRMTPSEALIAATLNAAHAVGLADRVGSLEPGKQADFVVLDMPNHLHLFYHFGTNPVEKVFFKGAQVCHNVNIFGEESSC